MDFRNQTTAPIQESPKQAHGVLMPSNYYQHLPDSRTRRHTRTENRVRTLNVLFHINSPSFFPTTVTGTTNDTEGMKFATTRVALISLMAVHSPSFLPQTSHSEWKTCRHRCPEKAEQAAGKSHASLRRKRHALFLKVTHRHRKNN